MMVKNAANILYVAFNYKEHEHLHGVNAVRNSGGLNE